MGGGSAPAAGARRGSLGCDAAAEAVEHSLLDAAVDQAGRAREARRAAAVAAASEQDPKGEAEARAEAERQDLEGAEATVKTVADRQVRKEAEAGARAQAQAEEGAERLAERLAKEAEAQVANPIGRVSSSNESAAVFGTMEWLFWLKTEIAAKHGKQLEGFLGVQLHRQIEDNDVYHEVSPMLEVMVKNKRMCPERGRWLEDAVT